MLVATIAVQLVFGMSVAFPALHVIVCNATCRLHYVIYRHLRKRSSIHGGDRQTYSQTDRQSVALFRLNSPVIWTIFAMLNCSCNRITFTQFTIASFTPCYFHTGIRALYLWRIKSKRYNIAVHQNFPLWLIFANGEHMI